MPSELKEKLNRWYWEGDPQNGFRLLPRHQSHYRNNNQYENRLSPQEVGDIINDLRCLVIHTNAGWVKRSIAGEHIENFRYGTTTVGYHFYIPGEGTLIRSINLDQPRTRSHARHVNGHSLGISALNIFSVNGFGNHFQSCTQNVEDIEGQKLYLTSGEIHNEVTPCWWTTQNYNNEDGIGTDQVNNTNRFFMFYNESQYRMLALTVKYNLEKYSLPWNFPLLPHARQAHINNNWDSLRRIILADQRALMLMRSLYHLNNKPVRPDISFDESDEIFEEVYLNNNNGLNESYKNQNRIIRNSRGNSSYFIKSKSIFDIFRGIHGHEFSQIDRNDPGPLFDWHRLARETSDYWWYPFDLEGTVLEITDDKVVMSNREYRSYRRFNEKTPILDYYWDERENESAYKAIETDSVMAGDSSIPGLSPATFNLPNNTSIYSMANGELVAAKLPQPGEDVCSGFLLVKHEIYHDTSHIRTLFPILSEDTITFDKRPSIVYSLYMHITRSTNISSDQPIDQNPDWLNRILIRKKECELGLDFYHNNRNTARFSTSRWNNTPPQRDGYNQNPTTLEGWFHDQRSLGGFLTDLRNGEIAMPIVDDFVQPINVILGDYLGDSGAIGNSRSGVRIEVFSPNFSPPEFGVYEINGWDPNYRENASQYYISEWNDTDWWRAVISQMEINTHLPLNERIRRDEPLYHFHPFEFMKWINHVTWKHEWPKYKVKDGDGNDVPIPERPRTRRIPPAS